MKNYIYWGLISVLIIFFSNQSSAQNTDLPCAFDILHEHLLETNLRYQSSTQSFDYQLVNNIQTRTDEVLYVPVVIHVMHLPEDTSIGTGSNISDAQIAAGLAHLNNAFRNEGAYADGPFFTNSGVPSVDVKIEFVLATIDENGDPMTGVFRHPTNYSNLHIYEAVPGGGNEDKTMKALSVQNTDQYLNIWLVNNICLRRTPTVSGCGVSGYTYFPAAHGAVNDGLTIKANTWGTSEINSKIQVHEVGHYLGLYHTFYGGCAETDCELYGDRICDTPPDNSTGGVSSGNRTNTCDTDSMAVNSPFTNDVEDIYENYMDYGNQGAWNTFTPMQKERMRAALLTERAGLLANSAVFPVELVDFSGKQIEQYIKLKWETQYEFQNDYFEIEYAADGRHFELAGIVLSKKEVSNTTTYEFIHRQPVSSTNYYRLKQVDTDGTYQYLDLISVPFSGETPWEITPISSQSIQIQGSSTTVTPIQITLFDVLGHASFQTEVHPIIGDNTFLLDLPKVHKGIYFVVIKQKESLYSKKININ